MKVDKSIITSISTTCSLEDSGLVNHADEISQRIEQSMCQNEKKIALGLRRTQIMRTE